MYCAYLLFGLLDIHTEEMHPSALIIECTRIECSHLINHCRRIGTVLYRTMQLCRNHHRIGLG